MTADVPAWFTDALAQSYDAREIEVDGVRISYRAWGKTVDPLAIDLSGHGDSGHRRTYALGTWAEEVMAVAHAESVAPPILLGHSMGGFVVLTAAQRHGPVIRGVAAIDSPVREMSPEAREWVDGGRHLPGTKVYPDREMILGRFRTLPADDASLPFVRQHLAKGSIREVEGGWTWKFDPRIFLRTRMEPEELAEASCEIALIRGERGLATTDITDVVAARLGRDVPVTVIRDAGHHLMLDQPIALTAVLQTLLGQWRNP
jgi:pimeloyl-ACP methyl ester carboxylesterase